MEGLGSRHRHHLCCVWSRVTSVYWELDPITQRGEERSAVTSKQSPKGFLAGTLGSGVRKNGYILDAVTQKSHVRERAAALQGRLLEPFPPSQLPATPFPACHTAVLPTSLPDYLSSGFLEQMFLASCCIKNKQALCCHSLSWGKSLCCHRFFWRGLGRAVKSLHAAPCQEFASRWMAGAFWVF